MNFHEQAQQLRNPIHWDRPMALIHGHTPYQALIVRIPGEHIKVQRFVYARLPGDGK